MNSLKLGSHDRWAVIITPGEPGLGLLLFKSVFIF